MADNDHDGECRHGVNQWTACEDCDRDTTNELARLRSENERMKEAMRRDAALAAKVCVALGNANADDIEGFAEDADAAGKYHTACILLAVAKWMREEADHG